MTIRVSSLWTWQLIGKTNMTVKPAYIIVDVDITDTEAYEQYKALAKPLAESFGGEYLTRGGEMDVIQNELWTPTRIVIVKFPSLQAARDFINSPEYEPVKAIRMANSAGTLAIIEGI